MAVEFLSVVDQSPIPDGATPADALANSIDLAQRCEQLGYHRYWLAEHHGSDGLAGSAPEILIDRIATATESMRIGSGGVMLTHYSPLKVAEQFNMLATLHPDRIDLGLGRAPGSNQLTAAALAKGPGALGPEHYPAQLQELRGFLSSTPDPDSQFRDLQATPVPPTAAAMWLLASSEGSVGIAAHFGLPLSFAHFITIADGPALVDAYRRQYQPSAASPEPKVNVAAAVICADTDQEAERLAISLQTWRARGLSGRIPAPEITEGWSPRRGSISVSNGRKPLIHGSPDTCRRMIEELADSYGTNEVMAITITHSHQARVRSYELLAKAFDLPQTP